MRYKNIHKAIFLERLHRFGALVDIDGMVEYVHVKNTGRCKELFIPGVQVFLEKNDHTSKIIMLNEHDNKYDIPNCF